MRSILNTINVLALAATLGINYLANALPINGTTTGAVSDSFEVLFKPAGFTFAIWGVIYLALVVWVIIFTRDSDANSKVKKNQAFLFQLSCATNAGWLLAWHYRLIGLSVLLMLVLLCVLILLYLSLVREENGKMALRYPVSLYLGWICIATMANITIWFDSLSWMQGELIESTAFAFLLVVGCIVAAFFVWKFRDPIESLVLAWAAFGISVHVDGQDILYIFSIVTAGCAVVIAASAFFYQRLDQSQLQ